MLLEDYSDCDVDCDTKYVSRTNSLIYLMDKIKVSLIFFYLHQVLHGGLRLLVFFQLYYALVVFMYILDVIVHCSLF